MRTKHNIYFRMQEVYAEMVRFYEEERRPATIRELGRRLDMVYSYVYMVQEELVRLGFATKSGCNVIPNAVGVAINWDLPTAEQFRNADLSSARTEEGSNTNPG